MALCPALCIQAHRLSPRRIEEQGADGSRQRVSVTRRDPSPMLCVAAVKAMVLACATAMVRMKLLMLLSATFV